ncbi:MAG: 3-deoxy-8-phosphooctulonate synthase [Candidatus Pacearchaeota archaeon]
MKKIKLKDFYISNYSPVVLIAGPCVIESEEHVLFMARELKKIANELNINLIFKTSYDKANRSSIDSYRGPGVDKGIQIFKKIKHETGLPILTDVHSIEEAKEIAEVVDVMQIPAFLSRQTDLIVEAAKTGKIINVKKGQFLAPWDVENIIGKIKNTGNDKIMITERGVSFGYNNLVSDMRSLVIIKRFGYPVVFDGTHSVQLPGGKGATSGGQREFVEPLSLAATSTGIASLFLEVHDNPDKALCDGPNMIKLKDLRNLLIKVKKIDEIIKNDG